MTDEELRLASELLPEGYKPLVTHRLRDAETQIETPPDHTEIPPSTDLTPETDVNYGALGF